MSDPGDSNRPHRPTLVVATIGHHRHGKTTLTAAITQMLARRTPAEVLPISPAQIDARTGSPPLQLHGERLIPSPAHQHIMGVAEGDELQSLTVTASEVRYATPQRAFVHIDSPGRRPWLKNAARAQALVDALVVVVSGAEGVQAQTHEHLLLARALGITRLVVFISKCDLVRDLEWLDLVEQDLRELLARCGFDGDGARIIRGAALPVLAADSPWESSVADLVEALERDLDVPRFAGEGPPLLYVHRVFSRRPDLPGVLVEGRVRRGSLRTGEVLRAVGHGEGLRVTVADLEMDRRKVERAAAGELAGVLLTPADLRPNQLRAGMALCEPTATGTRLLNVQVDLLATQAGGRRTSIRDGHLVSMLFGATVISARLRMGTHERLEPGASAQLRAELIAPIHVEPGMGFLLRDGNQGPLTPRGEAGPWAGTAGMGQVLGVTPLTT
jgi:elongation factor Tu